jgi:hypothetical protein
MAYESYETWLTETLAPSWLRGRYARAFLGVVGRMLDRITDGADAAVKVRFVAQAPVDALEYIGSERNLPRYAPDTDDTYRARLAAAWSLYEFAGTRQGILSALSALLPTTTIRVIANREWPIPPDGDTANWSRLWVLLSDTPWTSDGNWDDAGTWDDGGVWDSSATEADVLALRRIVRTWKAGHEVCAGFIVLLEGDDFWGPDEPWDSGTWDDTLITVWAGM